MQTTHLRARLILTAVALLLVHHVVFAQAKPTQRWGLVIGAQDYQHYPRLKYARSDAKRFRDFLVKDLSFSPEATKLLVDGGDADTKPSAGNILGALEDVLQSPDLNPTDTFVLYFAGHGFSTPSDDYLLPTDARDSTASRLGVSVTDVLKRLAESKIQNVWLVFDACRDGSSRNFGRVTASLSRKNKLALFMSCQPGAVSYEHPALEGGVFTTSMLTQLEAGSASKKPFWMSSLQSSLPSEMSRQLTKAKLNVKQVPFTFLSSEQDILLAVPSSVELTLPALQAEMKAKSLSKASLTSALLTYTAKSGDFADPYVYEAAKLCFAQSPNNEDARYLFASAAMAIGNIPLALNLVYDPTVTFKNSNIAYLRLVLAPFHFRAPESLVLAVLASRTTARTEPTWLRNSSFLIGSLYLLRFGATPAQLKQHLQSFEVLNAANRAARQLAELYVSQGLASEGSLTSAFSLPSLLKSLRNLYDVDPVTGTGVYQFILNDLSYEFFDSFISSLPETLKTQRFIAVARLASEINRWRVDYVYKNDTTSVDDLRGKWNTALQAGLTNADALGLVLRTGFPVLLLINEESKPRTTGSRYVDDGLATMVEFFRYVATHPGLTYEDSYKPTEEYLPTNAPFLEQTSELEQAFLIGTLEVVVSNLLQDKLIADSLSNLKADKEDISLVAAFRGFQFTFAIPGQASRLTRLGSSQTFWEAFLKNCDLNGESEVGVEYRIRNCGVTPFRAEYKSLFIKTEMQGFANEAFYRDYHSAYAQFSKLYARDFVLSVCGQGVTFGLVERLEKFWLSLGISRGNVHTTDASSEDKNEVWKRDDRLIQEFKERNFHEILYPDVYLGCSWLARDITGSILKNESSKIAGLLYAKEVAQYRLTACWLPTLVATYELAKQTSNWQTVFVSGLTLIIASPRFAAPWLRAFVLRDLCKEVRVKGDVASGYVIWRELERCVRSSIVRDIALVEPGVDHFSIARRDKGFFLLPNESRRSPSGNFELTTSKDGNMTLSFVSTSVEMTDGKQAPYGVELKASGKVDQYGLVEARCTYEREGKKSEGVVLLRLPGSDDLLPAWLKNLPISGYVILDGGGLGMFTMGQVPKPAGTVQEGTSALGRQLNTASMPPTLQQLLRN